MKHNFPKLQIAILLVIGITLLAVPLTRRYVALQLGLIPNGAPQLVGAVFTHSRANDPLENDSWNKLLGTVQHERELNDADDYIYQHPEQIALLTERVRRLIGATWLPERAGELGRIGVPQNEDWRKNQEKRKVEAKERFQRVIKLCLLGQKQESQNAYFDFLLSIVAYSEYRDDDAWNYLQSAIKKAHFDPHYLDLQEVALHNDERVLGRPLLWEEKYAGRGVIQLWELNTFRTWGQWMEWKAITQIRAGEMVDAMKTLEALSAMGNKIVHGAKLRTVAQIGSAMIAMAYYAPLQSQKPPPPQPKYDADGMPLPPDPPPSSLSTSPRLTQEQRYFKAQEYARNNQLPQLNKIGEDYLRSKRYLTNMLDIDVPVSYYDLTPGQITTMFLSWRLGMWSIFLAIGACAFWLLTSFVKKPQKLPSCRQTIICTTTSILTVCLFIGGFYIVSLSGDKWMYNIWSSLFSTQMLILDNLLSRGIALIIPLFIVSFGCTFAVLFTPWRQTLARIKNSSWRSRLKVLLGVLGFILVPLSLIFFGSNWPYLYEEAFRFPIDFIYRLYLFYIGGFVNPYFGNGLELDYETQRWEYAIMYLILGVIYFSLLWKFARTLRPQNKSGQLIYLMRRGLLSLAFCCVIFYGVCMVFTVVTRKSAEQKMMPFLKYGDLHVYGNKADLSGPVDPHRLFKKMEEINKHRVMRL